MDHADVLEELLHAIGNLALRSLACRRYFLKSALLEQPSQLLWKILKQHDGQDTVVEQVFFALVGVFHVASEIQQPVELKHHFFGHSYEATVQHMRSIPLQEQYAKCVAADWDGSAATTTTIATMMTTLTRYVKNETVSESAAHFIAGVVVTALLMTPPPSTEDGVAVGSDASSSSSVVKSTATTAAAASSRCASAYRFGHVQGNKVLDSLCDQGALPWLGALIQQHSSSEPVCLWSLLALLNLLSTERALKHISTHALCFELTNVAMTYSIHNPSLVILVYAILVQLCADASARSRLMQILADSGAVNFLMHALAHHLGNTEIVRLAFEVLAVMAFGPANDTLSFVCASPSAAAAAAAAAAATAGASNDAATASAAGDADAIEGISSADDADASATATVGGTAAAAAASGRSKFVPGSNLLFFATRLRKALTATGAAAAAGIAGGEAEAQLPVNTLDTLTWEAPEASRGGVLSFYDTASLLTGGLVESAASAATPSATSSALGGAAGMQAALAAVLIDTVSPLALVSLVTFQHDYLTLIAVMNALNSLAMDAGCRAKLYDQPDVFFTVLRLAKFTVMGRPAATAPATAAETTAPATDGDEATVTPDAPDAAAISSDDVVDAASEAPSAATEAAPTEATATSTDATGGYDVPPSTRWTLDTDEGVHRSVLVALIFHFIASACLPPKTDVHSGGSGSGGRRQRDLHLQQRQFLHQQRLIREMEILPLLLYTLNYFAHDTCLVEAALRCLHFVVQGGGEDFQVAFANVDVVTPVVRPPAHVLVAPSIAIVVQALKTSIPSPRVAYYAALAVSTLSQQNSMVSLAIGELNGAESIVKLFVRYPDHAELVEACCRAIFALKTLNLKWQTLGASELVLQAWQTHANNAAVAEWVCRAIGSLAEYDRNKADLDEGGVCKVVTAALQRHVASDALSLSSLVRVATSTTSSSTTSAAAAAGVAQWGCTAIYYLARGKDAEAFQTKLVAAGACEAVARALVKYSEVEAIAQACCRALVVLLFRNDAAKTKMGNLGVCACVVESLHLFPSSVDVAEWGCRAVAVLSESNEANTAKLALAGACESIPVVLQSHPASESVAIAGCDVVSFMSETIANGYAERFGHAGACEAVVRALKTHVDNVRAAARCSIALGTLARVSGNARWFGPAGACDALYQALTTHLQDLRIVKYVVVAIGNLCAIEFNKQRLGKLGVCEAVVAVAKLHHDDTETARACAATIWKLCETIDRQTVMAARRDAGGNSSSSGATATATSTMATVATSDTAAGAATAAESTAAVDDDVCRNRAKLFTAGVCEALLECLTPNYHDLATAISVARAVYVLCQGPGWLCESERERFYQLRIATLLVKTMQHHALSKAAPAPPTAASVEGNVTVDRDDLLVPQFHAMYDDLARFGCFALSALCGRSRRYATGYHRGNQQLLSDAPFSANLIVHILRHYRHPTVHNAAHHLLVVEGALSAIRNLTHLFPANQTAFGAAHVCEALLEILDVHGRSLDVVVLTAKTLFSVCDGHDANRLTLCYSGAAELLSAALQRSLAQQAPTTAAAAGSGGGGSGGGSAGSGGGGAHGGGAGGSGAHGGAHGGGSGATGASGPLFFDPSVVLIEYVLATMLGMAFHPVGRSRLLSAGVPKLLLQQVLVQRVLQSTQLPLLSSHRSLHSIDAGGAQVVQASVVNINHPQFAQAIAAWEHYQYVGCLACACLAALVFRGKTSNAALLSLGTSKTLTQVLHRACLYATLQQELLQSGYSASVAMQSFVPRTARTANSPVPSSSPSVDEFVGGGNVSELSLSPDAAGVAYSTATSTAAAATAAVETVAQGPFSLTTLAPADCTTTQFLHYRVDLVQEACRALFYLCAHTQPTSGGGNAAAAIAGISSLLQVPSISPEASSHVLPTNAAASAAAASAWQQTTSSSSGLPTHGLPPAVLFENDAKRQALSQGALDVLTSYASVVPQDSGARSVHHHAHLQQGSSSHHSLEDGVSTGNSQSGANDHNSSDHAFDHDDASTSASHVEYSESMWSRRLIDLLLNIQTTAPGAAFSSLLAEEEATVSV